LSVKYLLEPTDNRITDESILTPEGGGGGERTGG